ncbi:hypothetical protein LS71_009270 [Helicobacter jaachi]|uniref:DNA methyltransferase n=1 Tax=Helicobacter jaachi TaxID=1677920 RepID=A0A4U8T5A9_9HELI|nr:hypothetical protein [Helicobacter jaachi]TLD94633.1 hypothetical protein LS71_009270 [Helicobacter jaachi]
MRQIFMCYIILFAALLLLCGCADKVVYVPTKCDVPARAKPINQGSVIKYLKEVLIYAEGLERDLNFCRGAQQ